MNNKRLLLLCTIFVCCLSTRAQKTTDAIDTMMKLADLSVPDIPAFKALGIDNSKILTPSSLKTFAMSLSPFYSNGSVNFPQNFAAELAPAKLYNNLNTLRNYNYNAGIRLLLNSSISIATNRDSLKRTYLSIGYRGTIINRKQDIYTGLLGRSMSSVDSAKTILRYCQNIERLLTNIYPAKLLITSNGSRKLDSTAYVTYFNKLDSLIKNDPALKSSGIDSSYTPLKQILLGYNLNPTNLTKTEIFDYFETERQSMAKTEISNFQNLYWNATRLDWALAWTAASKDSTAQGATFHAFDVWVTGSFRLGKWGQWLIGINGTAPHSDSGFFYNLNGITRLYAGLNKVKGIFEFQYSFAHTSIDSKSDQFQGGIEVKLSKSLWAVALAGYQSKISGNFYSQLISSLNLKYGFN